MRRCPNLVTNLWVLRDFGEMEVDEMVQWRPRYHERSSLMHFKRLPPPRVICAWLTMSTACSSRMLLSVSSRVRPDGLGPVEGCLGMVGLLAYVGQVLLREWTWM
jgi:hypothetical protein